MKIWEGKDYTVSLLKHKETICLIWNNTISKSAQSYWNFIYIYIFVSSQHFPFTAISSLHSYQNHQYSLIHQSKQPWHLVHQLSFVTGIWCNDLFWCITLYPKEHPKIKMLSLEVLWKQGICIRDHTQGKKNFLPPALFSPDFWWLDCFGVCLLEGFSDMLFPNVSYTQKATRGLRSAQSWKEQSFS